MRKRTEEVDKNRHLLSKIINFELVSDKFGIFREQVDFSSQTVCWRRTFRQLKLQFQTSKTVQNKLLDCRSVLKECILKEVRSAHATLHSSKSGALQSRMHS